MDSSRFRWPIAATLAAARARTWNCNSTAAYCMMQRMNEMERSRSDLVMFAVGALGFFALAGGVITTSVAAVVGGLILMALAVCYFGIVGD